jgi:cytochrome c biogenesis protein CcmG, thiol:disulfide interchange protein DsbE
MRRLAAVVVLVAMAAACSSGGGADGSDVAAISYERFDGTEASLGDYEGTPLVVNFFASWCAPCITEMPALEEVHQHYGDEVAFLGLAMNDTVEDAQELVDRTGVTWDLGRDPRGEIIRELGGIGMPTTVLVTAEGRVVETHTGQLTSGELTELIDAELLS